MSISGRLTKHLFFFILGTSVKKMNVSTPLLLQSCHKNDLFSLTVNQSELKAYILMKLFVANITTKEFPCTYSMLQKNLPSIMHSKCFNSRNFPFCKEVRQTELGHLFEHILLEYLCHEKRTCGMANPIHSGITKWNWLEDKKGTFHIHIDVGLADKHIFNHALEKSIALMRKILLSKPRSMS